MVINIEHINVDRPKELNVQIDQNDIMANMRPLNNISQDLSTNDTKKAVRQNAKFFKKDRSRNKNNHPGDIHPDDAGLRLPNQHLLGGNQKWIDRIL